MANGLELNSNIAPFRNNCRAPSKKEQAASQKLNQTIKIIKKRQKYLAARPADKAAKKELEKLYLYIAKMLVKSKASAQALKEISHKGIELNSSSSGARFINGIAHGQNGAWKKANEIFNMISRRITWKSHPKSVKYLDYFRAFTEHKLGRNKDALTFVQRAIKGDRWNVNFRILASNIYQVNIYTSPFLSNLELTKKLDSSHPYPHIELGKYYKDALMGFKAMKEFAWIKINCHPKSQYYNEVSKYLPFGVLQFRPK